VFTFFSGIVNLNTPRSLDLVFPRRLTTVHFAQGRLSGFIQESRPTIRQQRIVYLTGRLRPSSRMYRAVGSQERMLVPLEREDRLLFEIASRDAGERDPSVFVDIPALVASPVRELQVPALAGSPVAGLVREHRQLERGGLGYQLQSRENDQHENNCRPT